MKSLFFTVTLVDPLTDERFPVTEDISLELTPSGVREAEDAGTVRQAMLDRSSGVFSVPRPPSRLWHNYHLRVRFLKPNFSKPRRRFLSVQEVTSADQPVYCPARLPFWDFPVGATLSNPLAHRRRVLRAATSPGRAFHLEIPLREVFIIGHRGAPMHFPENTIASFERALALGANGLELDLCLTRDRRIIIFHDPEPVKYPGSMDRTLFEGLPYPLVSPLFDITGREVMLKEWKGADFRALPSRPLAYEDEFHIVTMTLQEVRSAYHYAAVDGTEYPIPTLEEFLEFASRNRDRLRFVFFDVKNPVVRERKKTTTQIGEILGCALQRFAQLPPHLVVVNEKPVLLRLLKRALQGTGEERCAFAYDASGGLEAIIGMDRQELVHLPWWLRPAMGRVLPWSYSPVDIARRMRNSVVSIGNLMRPAHMREILAAVHDRDNDVRSTIEYVIHWTLNDREQFAESFEAGVNGILTDRPDSLLEYLSSLGFCVRAPEARSS